MHYWKYNYTVKAHNEGKLKNSAIRATLKIGTFVRLVS
jgi:hypothetical protein